MAFNFYQRWTNKESFEFLKKLELIIGHEKSIAFAQHRKQQEDNCHLSEGETRITKLWDFMVCLPMYIESWIRESGLSWSAQEIEELSKLFDTLGDRDMGRESAAKLRKAVIDGKINVYEVKNEPYQIEG